MSGSESYVYVLIKFTTDSFLGSSYTYYSWSHTSQSAMTACAIWALSLTLSSLFSDEMQME